MLGGRLQAVAGRIHSVQTGCSRKAVAGRICRSAGGVQSSKWCRAREPKPVLTCMQAETVRAMAHHTRNRGSRQSGDLHKTER